MQCWQTVLLKPQLRADTRDCHLSTHSGPPHASSSDPQADSRLVPQAAPRRRSRLEGVRFVEGQSRQRRARARSSMAGELCGRDENAAHIGLRNVASDSRALGAAL